MNSYGKRRSPFAISLPSFPPDSPLASRHATSECSSPSKVRQPNFNECDSGDASLKERTKAKKHAKEKKKERNEKVRGENLERKSKEASHCKKKSKSKSSSSKKRRTGRRTIPVFSSTSSEENENDPRRNLNQQKQATMKRERGGAVSNLRDSPTATTSPKPSYLYNHISSATSSSLSNSDSPASAKKCNNSSNGLRKIGNYYYRSRNDDCASDDSTLSFSEERSESEEESYEVFSEQWKKTKNSRFVSLSPNAKSPQRNGLRKERIAKKPLDLRAINGDEQFELHSMRDEMLLLGGEEILEDSCKENNCQEESHLMAQSDEGDWIGNSPRRIRSKKPKFEHLPIPDKSATTTSSLALIPMSPNSENANHLESCSVSLPLLPFLVRSDTNMQLSMISEGISLALCETS